MFQTIVFAYDGSPECRDALKEGIELPLKHPDAFRRIGCRFSLDDFGSGLCSFGYLQSLPVDEVKIDGRFIQDAMDNVASAEIIRAIHQVAKATGKKTVAEFVDDPRKLAVLQEIGFDYAQGWLFYPSIPSERLIELVMVDRRASRAMVAD